MQFSIFLVVLLQVWTALCREIGNSAVDPMFPADCGDTPMYGRAQIVGGSTIPPDEYSWLANLRYGNGSDGFCSGSVINSRYVLTSAQCVSGELIRHYGGLTGVRLGDFDDPRRICDYGSDSCDHYQQFGIEKIIVHSGYNRGVHSTVHNIALIRLDRSIQFGSNMKPICLPIRGTEPAIGYVLTVTGWSETLENDAGKAKHAADVPLWDTKHCIHSEYSHANENLLCAGRLPSYSCMYDAGSPLMLEISRQRMVLEGIQSYGVGNCRDRNSPMIYTRVRSYGEWLKQQMDM